MDICKKCSREFTPSKGLINYCSLSCRNSREWTEADKIKISHSAKNSEKVKLANKNKPPSLWTRISELRKENHKNYILKSEYTDLSFQSLRFRILYEQKESCNKCGLSEWLGKPLTLELEHIDGNHFNNSRENLEMICPNCHSLTTTWRGRNKKEQKFKISDEKLLESLIIHYWNFRKSLIFVGLSPKGGNYNRCHRLKREYDSVA